MTMVRSSADTGTPLIATVASDGNLLDAFGEAMACYDVGTAEHAARVGSRARRVAMCLGLHELEVEALHWAGLLHDVGKLAVPTAILRKPGPLTPDEWRIIKRHPDVGADLLVTIAGPLAPIAAGVRSHHERWDGAGYPLGLAGAEIPLSGRILTIVDVFDALTHSRRYRPSSFDAEDALDYVVGNAGIEFDPEVVPAFVDVYRRESMDLDREGAVR